MTIKNKIIALAMMLAALPLFAQKGQNKISKDFEVSMGEPYKVTDAKVKEYFSDENGHIVSVKSAGDRVTIQLYDANDMKQLNAKTYEDFPKNNEVQGTIKAGNHLFYIFSAWNKKAKKTDVYARQIDMSTGLFDDYKLLFSSSREVDISARHELAGTGFIAIGAPICFLLNKSFNEEKLMITYRLEPEKKSDAKNYDVLGFYVFNTATLEQQWGGEVKMPYTEKQMNNISYGVTNDGKAYMLAYLNEPNKLELFEISSNLEVKTNPLNIDSKFYFRELKLRETSDGNLMFVGLYSQDKISNVRIINPWDNRAPLGLAIKANGVLSFKMNREGKILESHDFEFPVSLINQYESERNKKRNGKKEAEGKLGVDNLNLVTLSLDAEGGTTVIGEQQYSVTTGMGSNRKTYFYYTDVIALKFDKKGQLAWMKKLPKEQQGGALKGGMSVAYVKGKSSHYVLFLDNVKNANLPLSKVPATHIDGKGGFLTAYKIDDATGDVEKHVLFDTKAVKGKEVFQFFTSRIFKAKEGTFFTEVYLKGKEDGMIRMELVK
jgi:hypothetical protein